MTGRTTFSALLLSSALSLSICLCSPALGFIEKLKPNNPEVDGIPCNAIGAILFFYIDPAGPSGGVLNSIIQREWVPGGWSAQDLTDNQNIIGLINAAPTTDAKENLVHKITYFCMLWEMGVDEVNSPSKFRTRLGIPQAP